MKMAYVKVKHMLILHKVNVHHTQTKIAMSILAKRSQNGNNVKYFQFYIYNTPTKEDVIQYNSLVVPKKNLKARF